MRSTITEAIEKVNGSCVILAGAGTGKTHTIVEKIKYLINHQVCRPENIVAITFSNEAANSLMVRVQKAMDLEQGKEPIIKTFHSFSADLLRKYGHLIDVKEDFKILEPDDAKVVLHKSFKIAGYYCHKYIDSIGTAKDLGISLDDLKKYVDNLISGKEDVDLNEKLEKLQFELQTLHLKKEDGKKQIVIEIENVNRIIGLRKFVNAWAGYEKLKVKGNYQDYSDLNKNALDLLIKKPEIAEEYGYVIVDEFQDTNKVQLDLIINLCKNGNITVVGDLNQSIYRFRGAYKDNFALFNKHFNVDMKDIFALDKSYRSSNKILKLAYQLILNNYENKEDVFFVNNFENREGENIELYEMKNAREESRKIVELVKREIALGTDLNDICVLFRTHQQGRIIKRALEIEGIAYSSLSKNALLKHNAVKKAIYYLTILEKVANNKKGGDDSWWNLMYELNFEKEDLVKIGKFIKDNKKENISEKLMGLDLELSQQGRMAYKVLIEKIKMLLPFAKKNVDEIIPEVYRVAGLISNEKVEEITRGEKEDLLNLNRFYELCKNQGSLYSYDLPSFIYYLDILDNLGIEIEGAEIEEQGVRLMTLHSTKGLEYKTVIVSNLAQKRFPIERITPNLFIPLELSPEFKNLNLDKKELEEYSREYERKHQLMEERRLCYVAFTRAKERLILTYAKEYGGKKYSPSQFLTEINYKENENVDYIIDVDEKMKEDKKEIKLDDFKTGDKINEKEMHFSPSALLTFLDCQKSYEYKYVYNMPDKKMVNWEAVRLGSFIHLVLEKGVKEYWRTLKDFEDYSKELHLQEDWQEVDLNEALHMVKVFYERNKDKYDERSKTELLLKANIEGLNFIGFADRIDFNDSGIEIIDYKTGKQSVSPKHRNWQLGYYALAASKYGKVRKMTLEMLKQEKPLEFELDDKGNANSVNSYIGFNVYEVKNELVDTANQVLNAYKKGFKACPIEKNCEFCNEYVYSA